MQNALAQSSNTAFTDLAHRATTAAIIQMASNYGVNINNVSQRLEPAANYHGQVPAVALGEASLTVNEQTQMLATIDDNGVFHSGHVVKSWQLPDQAVQTPVVATHTVLTPAQDSQVQYAMEDTTVDGTAVNAADGPGRPARSSPRPAPPRTTCPGSSSARSRSTRWSSGCSSTSRTPPSPARTTCPTWAAAGSAVSGPRTSGTPSPRPSSRNLTPESFPNPQFSGQLWNQIGPLPKAKPKKKPTPKCTVTIHGKSFPIPGKGCPTATPTPTPTGPQGGFPTFPGQTRRRRRRPL